MKSEWQWMVNVQLQRRVPRGNPFPPRALIDHLVRIREQGHKGGRNNHSP